MEEAVGLPELLRPVRTRLGAAVGLPAVAAVVAVVPFAAVAELARVLLVDGPVDEGRAWAVAAVAAGALAVWVLLSGTAGALAHHADLDFQLSVRRRMVDRLGRVPLGWFTDRGSRLGSHGGKVAEVHREGTIAGSLGRDEAPVEVNAFHNGIDRDDVQRAACGGEHGGIVARTDDDPRGQGDA